MNTMHKFLCFFLALGFLHACSKDAGDDISLPSVTYLEPSSGANFNVRDTVNIKVHIRSERPVSKISISILNENFSPVTPAKGSDPGKTDFILEEALVLSNENLPSGDYVVFTSAVSSAGEAKAYRKIRISGMPRRFKELIYVSQINSLKTTVTTVDSAHNQETRLNLNSGFAGLAVSSFNTQVYLATPEPSHVLAYDAETYELQWDYSPPAPHTVVFDIMANIDVVYVSTGNGNIAGLNAKGAVVYTTPVNTDRMARKIFRHDHYMICYQTRRSDLKKYLAAFHNATGFYANGKEIDMEVAGFGTRDASEVYIFANRNDTGMLRAYHVLENTLADLDMPEGKIITVLPTGQDEIMVATSEGVYSFSKRKEKFTLKIAYGGIEHLAFDEVNGVLYASTGTHIRVYDHETGGLMNVITSGYDVRAMDVRYDR